MDYLDPGEVLQRVGEWPLLDVRTPSEYRQGHIPGALNLPLFSDEERVEVGTLYKQVSPEKAFLRGLDFAGARMRWYVEEARRMAPEGKAILHCWRGGDRSGSLAWLLAFSGFEVLVLRGGYKAYRNLIFSQFAERSLPLLVLGGPTGSGKTLILKALRALGEQVIDLEQLARHKGSAFGALGELSQPTVEQFENDLHAYVGNLDDGRRIWVENESRAIGRVFQPEGFWKQLIHAPLIELERNFQDRVRYLVEEYACFPKEDLMEAFGRLRKRLGGQNVTAAIEAIELGEFAAAAEIALQYYDKSYRYATENKADFQQVWKFPTSGLLEEEIAQLLVELADANGI